MNLQKILDELAREVIELEAEAESAKKSAEASTDPLVRDAHYKRMRYATYPKQGLRLAMKIIESMRDE